MVGGGCSSAFWGQAVMLGACSERLLLAKSGPTLVVPGGWRRGKQAKESTQFPTMRFIALAASEPQVMSWVTASGCGNGRFFAPQDRQCESEGCASLLSRTIAPRLFASVEKERLDLALPVDVHDASRFEVEVVRQSARNLGRDVDPVGFGIGL